MGMFGFLVCSTLLPESFEVILILNGCCEPYKSQIENYVLEHNMANFRLIQTNQAGVSNARNIGLDNVRGDYIAFIDDDDVISNDYLEKLLVCADNNVIVASDVKAFYKSSLDSHYDYISKAYKRWHEYNTSAGIFLKRSFLSSCCCKLIPKRMVSDTRFDKKISIGEDSLFMLSISNKIEDIVLANDAIYYRRLRVNSASRNRKSLYERLDISYKLFIAYCKVYFRKPCSYNMFLFLSRILASFLKIIKS